MQLRFVRCTLLLTFGTVRQEYQASTGAPYGSALCSKGLHFRDEAPALGYKRHGGALPCVSGSFVGVECGIKRCCKEECKQESGTSWNYQAVHLCQLLLCAHFYALHAS